MVIYLTILAEYWNIEKTKGQKLQKGCLRKEGGVIPAGGPQMGQVKPVKLAHMEMVHINTAGPF